MPRSPLAQGKPRWLSDSIFGCACQMLMVFSLLEIIFYFTKRPKNNFPNFWRALKLDNRFSRATNVNPLNPKKLQLSK